MKRLSFALLPLAFLTVACVPGASVISPPTFELRSGALVRLEPPGVGRGAAVIRLEVDVSNPNPVAVRLAGLDGAFYLADRRVASSRFPGGIALAARGTERWVLEVETPVEGAVHVLTQMARLVSGQPVPYRLDGSLAVEVLGAEQRFPTVTVARGELPPPGPLRAPSVRFEADASRVRLDGLTAVIEVGLAIDNPTVLGFEARGPRLEVRLDGRPVGRATIPVTPVPAGGSTLATLRVEAGIAELGTALMASLQSGASSVEARVAGDLTFELPGVASTTRDLGDVGGPLR